MKQYILPAVIGLTASTSAFANNHAHHNHSNSTYGTSYSPVQVMGAHSHNKDEWMVSYRYGQMHMEGLQQGNDSISNAQAFAAGYMVAPVKMTTEMHMFSAMKGLTDDFTFMAMTSYQKKDMKLVNNAGVAFSTKAEGFGDTKLSLIDNLNRYGYTNWSTMVTLSLPTGSTDQEYNTPMGANTRLPYPMQLGSGTYDITPAVTYECTCRDFSMGAQAFATFRFNDNEEDYRLGSEYGFKAWAGKEWVKNLNAGLTFNWLTQNSISGSDDLMNSNMVVTADRRNTGFDRASLALDVAYKPAVLRGAEIVTTYEEPIYQDVNGIQMESKRMFSVGVRKTF